MVAAAAVVVAEVVVAAVAVAAVDFFQLPFDDITIPSRHDPPSTHHVITIAVPHAIAAFFFITRSSSFCW